MLYWLIVGCEAAFWLVLALALAVRYLLGHATLSRALLLSLPAIDLLLLAFTAVDLKSGTPATFAHGLATAYVAFTVAFGSVVVRWADDRFAHRFAAGPPPVMPPKYGWPAVRYEFALWFRSILAAVIAILLLIALIAFIDDEKVTAPLHAWFGFAAMWTGAWFIFGPVWSMVFFRRGQRDAMTREAATAFAADWAAAWNGGNVERVLGLFSDDVTFTSPTALAVVGTATVRGKAALREYWTNAMGRISSLRFTIDRVLWDPEARELAIVYVSEINGAPKRVSENLKFGADGLVISAEVFHGVAD
ncbi:MAG TPA: nuclear transport factor 2 family protein [Steroidobacteraceae bacterium]|nr:nuclear transport factor 2 family protein [Steroidobacteraceae bacterium]